MRGLPALYDDAVASTRAFDQSIRQNPYIGPGHFGPFFRKLTRPVLNAASTKSAKFSYPGPESSSPFCTVLSTLGPSYVDLAPVLVVRALFLQIWTENRDFSTFRGPVLDASSTNPADQWRGLLRIFSHCDIVPLVGGSRDSEKRIFFTL